VDPLVTILSVLGGVLSGVGAVLAVLYARARGARDDLRETIRGEEALKNAADAAQRQAQASLDAAGSLRGEVRGLAAQVTALDSRASVLEAKLDVFWRNVAFDVSKILHSPHPGWEELDGLLEKFRDQAISPAEQAELEDHLRAIVDGRWTAGQVARADQVAASLLLRALEQTRA
jgi:hypothetical protein